MNNKLKKQILLFTAATLLSLALAGCNSSSASNPGSDTASSETKTQTDEQENLTDTQTPSDEPADAADEIKGNRSENQNGSEKWHVFDSELAAYMDADFECFVWQPEEGFFMAAEIECELLEDGSLLSVAPSSDSSFEDFDLFKVIYDDNTRFYIRNIYDNGERYEDIDAGPENIEKYLDCNLKGYFENNNFYASEIRIINVQ